MQDVVAGAGRSPSTQPHMGRVREVKLVLRLVGSTGRVGGPAAGRTGEDVEELEPLND